MDWYKRQLFKPICVHHRTTASSWEKDVQLFLAEKHVDYTHPFLSGNKSNVFTSAHREFFSFSFKCLIILFWFELVEPIILSDSRTEHYSIWRLTAQCIQEICETARKRAESNGLERRDCQRPIILLYLSACSLCFCVMWLMTGLMNYSS